MPQSSEICATPISLHGTWQCKYLLHPHTMGEAASNTLSQTQEHLSYMKHQTDVISLSGTCFFPASPRLFRFPRQSEMTDKGMQRNGL